MKIRTLFDTEADRYDRWFDSIRGRRILALELACVDRGIGGVKGHWLEVGVGTGRFAQALGIREGVDPSRAMLDRAAQRGIRACGGRAEQLPYRDKVFDGLLMATTVCFLDDPPKAFRECRRVLKEDGRMIVALIPADSPWGALAIQKGQASHSFYHTAKFYTCWQVVRLAADAGFVLEGAKSCLLSAPEEPIVDGSSAEGIVPDAGFVVLEFRPRKRGHPQKSCELREGGG